MKVLFFYDGRRNCTSRLQSDFILKLRDLCDINIYGKNEHKLNPRSICPIEYDSSITANDLIKELKPDIFLFHNIATFGNCKPKDLNRATVPIVMFEIDYYDMENRNKLNWFIDNRIDFLINRGPYEKCVVPWVWLPFSANEKEFYTDINNNYFDNRNHELAFIGNRGGKNPLYNVRKNAIEILTNNKLLHNIGFVNDNYATSIKEYTMLLSCSFPPRYNPPAKTFEFMASGTAVLTTKIRLKELLFGTEKCYFEYKEDMSDICNVVKYMLNNKDEVEEVTRNALSVINERHLDKHRIVELYDILKSIVDGKSLPRKWGY